MVGLVPAAAETRCIWPLESVIDPARAFLDFAIPLD